ncbi:hypothetical protein B0F90DRAFT_1702438, partial [Multifurca ochricompacta]
YVKTDSLISSGAVSSAFSAPHHDLLGTDAKAGDEKETKLSSSLPRRLHITMTSANVSPQLSVVHQFYEAISGWKFDVLEAVFADDYRHTTLPASANDPPKNKAQGIAYAKAVGTALGYVPVKYEIFKYNEAPESIWVHSRLYNDHPDGPHFSNESIFIFTLSSGSHIQITSIQNYRHQADRGCPGCCCCCCLTLITSK